MGAWGPGIFDDDTAYDYIEEIENAENPKDVFIKAFETAMDTDYLEYDDCHAVTVSASYIDSIINGTKPRVDAADENFYPFIEKHKMLDVMHLKANAVKALEIVMSDNSELNELWSDNAELYPKWRGNIQDLIDRLK